MENRNNVNSKKIYAKATDPIYIGTGGYTIGRVDNTIVRDPITKIPKIPGSSLAGTWRYYVALELISKIKEYQPSFENIKNRDGNTLEEKIKNTNWNNDFKEDGWIGYFGNKVAKITCAGQDNVPNGESPDETNKEGKTGHCGHCIVCKAFGYSKKDRSWQGMLFFSDLNILFFPVYTRLGTKWITSKRILKEADILKENLNEGENEKTNTIFVQEEIDKDKTEKFINLGWLNLPYEKKEFNIDLPEIKDIDQKDIFIVPDSLIAQIINSNLEVRTSVSIDPITGAAKEGALFTSEAIPRGTIFYGSIRLFDKSGLDKYLPNSSDIWDALNDTKKYYETLGIGGMTTRGFGRMKILTKLSKDSKNDGGSQNDQKS